MNNKEHLVISQPRVIYRQPHVIYTEPIIYHPTIYRRPEYPIIFTFIIFFIILIIIFTPVYYV